MGAVEGFKTALEAVRVMQDVAATAANADLNRRVAEAYGAVATAYAEAIELREENLRLKREIEVAKDKRDLRLKLSRDQDTYYFKEPPPGYHAGPYCAQCFDDDEKLLTLRQNNEYGQHLNWLCGRCEHYSQSSKERRVT